MEWLQRSAESQPENPRFAYVYGVALGSADQTERALSVFEEAMAGHPYDRDILTALATYNRNRGIWKRRSRSRSDWSRWRRKIRWRSCEGRLSR